MRFGHRSTSEIVGLITTGVSFKKMINKFLGRLLSRLLISAIASAAVFDCDRAIAIESADNILEAPAILSAIDLEQVDLEPKDTRILAQVTSISELSDVQPGDWAYTALQRLVEEYGCLEGYPDRTFRGNQALTRYEFAAGLNACLDVVVQLIGSGSDLDIIRRLQNEFAAELATVRSEVDALQTDVAELSANQFSTTTKLRGVLDAHLVVPFSNATVVLDTTTSKDPTAAPNATDGIVGGPEADAAFEYWGRL